MAPSKTFPDFFQTLGGPGSEVPGDFFLRAWRARENPVNGQRVPNFCPPDLLVFLPETKARASQGGLAELHEPGLRRTAPKDSFDDEALLAESSAWRSLAASFLSLASSSFSLFAADVAVARAACLDSRGQSSRGQKKGFIMKRVFSSKAIALKLGPCPDWLKVFHDVNSRSGAKTRMGGIGHPPAAKPAPRGEGGERGR